MQYPLESKGRQLSSLDEVLDDGLEGKKFLSCSLKDDLGSLVGLERALSACQSAHELDLTRGSCLESFEVLRLGGGGVTFTRVDVEDVIEERRGRGARGDVVRPLLLKPWESSTVDRR